MLTAKQSTTYIDAREKIFCFFVGEEGLDRARIAQNILLQKNMLMIRPTINIFDDQYAHGRPRIIISLRNKQSHHYYVEKNHISVQNG